MHITLDTSKIPELEQMGLIDRIALQNYRIREKYIEFQIKGLTSINIEQMLGKEFFLAPESIHRIRYDKNSK